MKKRVVVLGAGGFVGSHIVNALDKTRYDIVPVTRALVDFADTGSATALNALLADGDIVVCAAAKAPAKNFDMLAENVVMISHIAEALRNKRIAYLLNISSDAVYGDSMEPLTEESALAPLSAHGIMHCMREYILEQRVDAPIGHLRPTLIYGEGDPHNGYGPNSFLRLAQYGKPIALFGNGEERRDHVFIGDVAALAVSMIEKNIMGAVNAVSGEVISFHAIAECVSAAFGGAVEITSNPRTGPMPHNGYRAFDNRVARKACPGLQFTALRDYIAARAPARVEAHAV